MRRRRRAHDGSQRRASSEVDRMGSYVSTEILASAGVYTIGLSRGETESTSGEKSHKESRSPHEPTDKPMAESHPVSLYCPVGASGKPTMTAGRRSIRYNEYDAVPRLHSPASTAHGPRPKHDTPACLACALAAVTRPPRPGIPGPHG